MNKLTLPPKVYRANHISQIFGVSLATVWRYKLEGKLTAIKVSSRVTVFDANEVHKLFGVEEAQDEQ